MSMTAGGAEIPLHKIPKVELHAHLGGSYSWDFLEKEYVKRGFGDATPFLFKKALKCDAESKSASDLPQLSECFKYFGGVYKVADNMDFFKRSLFHVFHNYYEDNVCYLELRTGPRGFKDCFTGQEVSPEDYVRTIVECLEEFRIMKKDHTVNESTNPEANPPRPFVVKLLLSLKRCSLKSVPETVAEIDRLSPLIEQFPDFIVGFDICGNPEKKTMNVVLDGCLQHAELFKRYPLTVHCGECADEEEIDLVLAHLESLNIQRLGHCCFFNEKQMDFCFDYCRKGGKLGVEFCLSSNLVTLGRSMEGIGGKHFFPEWWKQQQQRLVGDDESGQFPMFSVNTDDCGLFDTRNTKQCELFSEMFGMGSAEMRELQRQGLESAFCSEDTKRDLRGRFTADF